MNALEEFSKILCDVFELKPEDVIDSKTPDDIPKWTSITHMDLCARFETLFKFQFDVEEITAMDSIGAMKKVIRGHGVSL